MPPQKIKTTRANRVSNSSRTSRSSGIPRTKLSSCSFISTPPVISKSNLNSKPSKNGKKKPNKALKHKNQSLLEKLDTMMGGLIPHLKTYGKANPRNKCKSNEKDISKTEQVNDQGSQIVEKVSNTLNRDLEVALHTLNRLDIKDQEMPILQNVFDEMLKKNLQVAVEVISDLEVKE
ncbi:hypothetical protein G9A89_009119 [Geosiphon pyriformis]|nr:hypothetical protein G9A89_009119 [Geosiphon pyriformis]